VAVLWLFNEGAMPELAARKFLGTRNLQQDDGVYHSDNILELVLVLGCWAVLARQL